jgi:Protein of unknown function (DUF3987)
VIGFSVHRDIINKGEPFALADNWEWVETGTPERLLKAVTVKGCAFTPGHWADGYDKRLSKDGKPKGERKAWKHAILGNLIEAWYVALDFDGGMSLEEGLDHEVFNNKAAFLYTSPSHGKPGKGDRFRVVFALSEPVTTVQELNYVIKGLRAEVAGDDDKAINAASALYGCKDSLVVKRFNNLENRVDPRPYIQEGEALRVARLLAREEESTSWDDLKDDADEDLPALMVHCLREHTTTDGKVFRYIPERVPEANTYDIARNVVSGLVHTFGGDLAYKIIKDANWWGDWDVEQEIEKYEFREQEFDAELTGGWCDYRTVLKLAREELSGFVQAYGKRTMKWECPAMPEADLQLFKRSKATVVQHTPEAIDEYKEIEQEEARKRLQQLARLRQLNVSELFPQHLNEAIHQVAKSLSVAPEAVATAFLTGACYYLGGRHNMKVLGSFTVPAILWIAILQGAGTRKSAIKKASLRAIYNQDRADSERYNKELEVYNRELAAWIEAGKKDEKPREPRRPRDYIITGGTAEGLEAVLGEPVNKNTVLRVLDELVGHFNSFDQHKGGGKGNQRQKELLLWDGDYSKDVRATQGATRVLTNPRVPTLGFSQPEKLVAYINNAGGLEYSDDGMWGRWLYVRPPYIPLTIDIDTMDEDLTSEYTELTSRIFNMLSDLPPMTWKPTYEAQLRIREAMLDLDVRTREEGSTFMKNVLSKMMGQCARLCLVVAAVKWATNPLLPAGVVDLETVESCIKVCEYFIDQAAALKVELPSDTASANNAHNVYVEAVIKYLSGRAAGDVVTAKMVQGGVRIMREEKKPAAFVHRVFKEIGDILPTKYECEGNKIRVKP